IFLHHTLVESKTLEPFPLQLLTQVAFCVLMLVGAVAIPFAGARRLLGFQNSGTVVLSGIWGMLPWAIIAALLGKVFHWQKPPEDIFLALFWTWPVAIIFWVWILSFLSKPEIRRAFARKAVQERLQRAGKRRLVRRPAGKLRSLFRSLWSLQV